ncbi:hypothetical protein H4S03_004335 [Coemansia sp. S3946]|nr:hypothetical protein H4S03_004335 [Coemansia sp. S3946]
MSGEADTRSKAEIAQAVAQWATEELGFRKPSTLVSAKGEEKIEATDVEPLLQGDLVRILDLATRHVVSSRRASYTRHKLAAYCAHPTPDPKLAQLPYIALRRSLKQLEAKESALLSEIEGVELDNRAAVQSISDFESKRNAVEARIRELRLQILVKQAVAEKIRRLSKRMKVLVQEMTSSYSSTHATASSMDLSWSADATSSTHNHSALTPPDRIGELLTQLRSAKPANSVGGQAATIADDAYKQQQLMIACVISCLKDLEDQHVQMWNTVKTLRSRITEGRSELDRKIELAASQLNMSVASAGGSALDFRAAILRAVIQDAVSQVGSKVGTFVPALEIADVCTWVSDDHMETVRRRNTVSELVESIEHVRALLAATRNAAQESAEYAASNVAPANEQLLKASRYSDMREAWNAIGLIRLQHINVDSKSADKLVTRSSFMDPGRGKVLSDICREAVVGGVAGQTHEATIAKLRDQLARAEARKALEAWAEESNAATCIKVAGESVETEAAITQLSDTRLFTELFAPWHKRDGVEYAEYLKQLKIARASETQQ